MLSRLILGILSLCAPLISKLLMDALLLVMEWVRQPLRVAPAR